VEIPLLTVLANVETQGVKLDVEAMEEYSKVLGNRIEIIEKKIYEHAGHSFNIASPKQLGVVLFEELKITSKPKMTKTKQYKTGEEILVKLMDRHEIVALILEFRTLSKLKSTYVDSLPKLVNPRTGKIHTSYNQAVAATGRLSSNNPNLQNIPVRSAEGREIRKAFIPSDEQHTLLAADYSQIELRIIAHLSQDANMMADFKAGKDIHTATAARVYGIAEEEVTKDMRRNAKSVNFGIIYGISAFGLSENLDISRQEAKEIIENYFLQYPGIKKFMDDQIDSAKEKGFVETILKRRRYLRDINSSNAIVRGLAERNAINAPIQGSSADMIKIAMINIQAEMKKRNLQSTMILQVHDELIFDCLLTELDELRKLVTDKMKNAMPLSLPLEVDSNNGVNWLVAH
jgi:DNA polymerase-1